MAQLSVDQERLANSRLFHRFGFGPKPGEFESAMKSGFVATKKKFATQPNAVQISADLLPITIDDIGPRPTPGTFALLEDVLKTPAAQILNGWKGRVTSLLRKG